MIARALLLTLVLAAPAQAGERLYTAPADTAAAHQARAFAKAGRNRDARLMRKLSRIPQARWFTGGTARQVRRAVDRRVSAAARRGSVPVLVAYNLPSRGCDARGYGRWVDGFAAGIGRRAAIVVVEPDALAGVCGGGRRTQLRAAVDRLERLPAASVYVDAGHSRWQPAHVMARRLRSVHARAFALNVASFRRTRELVAYGSKISAALGGAHFVIDTSRNGRGPWHGEPAWCNPPGRGLGARPTTSTGIPRVDAFLWIKIPGESDGRCAGNDPPAGTWSPVYALGLARRASPPL